MDLQCINVKAHLVHRKLPNECMENPCFTTGITSMSLIFDQTLSGTGCLMSFHKGEMLYPVLIGFN
jgi:hypothetical protein